MVKVEKHHLWKPSYMGKLLANSQFEIISTSKNLIKPQPWLGIEELDSEAVPVVIEMLAEVPHLKN